LRGRRRKNAKERLKSRRKLKKRRKIVSMERKKLIKHPKQSS
jgi:hypothetical protein